MDIKQALTQLNQLADPRAVEGMSRFGIRSNNTLGISIPNLRKLAKGIGGHHDLAVELWATGIHEARILASMVDNPKQVDEAQAERWVRDFDSWDVCDQCVMNLFEDTEFAWDKAVQWSAEDAEFVKRAGFVLMARLAVSDKRAPDNLFLPFLPIIIREAGDSRNFVKKAVNWALRQIGKRNQSLNYKALDIAREIQRLDSSSAKWIAAGAIRELTSAPVRERLAAADARGQED